MEGTNFKDFKNELLSNPDIRVQYETLKPKYAIIHRIIARRNELSLSQRDVARRAKMHQPAYCRFESGDKGVTVDTLLRVVGALDMDIELRPKVKA